MTPEDAFTRVLGRQATDEDRIRLHRLKDALGLTDNDAFWLIVMALEHYDAIFRQYPERLAEETRQSIEGARAAFAAAAEKEAANLQTMLSRNVAATGVAIARQFADKPVETHWVTLVLAAVVAFGALCVVVGASLGSSERPFWVASGGPAHGPAGVLAAVLSVPAGWMVFVLLVPAAVAGVNVGWARVSDVTAERRERVAGWGLVGLCVVGCAACAVILARLIGR